MGVGLDKRQQFVNQITTATNVVMTQLNRLKFLDNKFGNMEAYYLEQITHNIKTGNNARAKIIASELANVRKIRRTTQHTGLALETLVIRFSTIHEFANILDTIDPTVEMIKGIHSELTKAIPAANEALAEVSTVTTDVLLNSNIKADARVSMPVDADALSILNEIEGVLEDEAKSKLPEVPTGMPTMAAKQQERQEEEGVLVES
jgi:division protein CdvB (Snf7/Vps24/ESCRT-III family)